MSKYIKNFNQTGKTDVNVGLVCKNWTNFFSISTWINDSQEKYTLVINGKRKGSLILKVEISKNQALEIIDNLNLIHVKSTFIRSGGTYHSKSFISSEIERLRNLKKDKEIDLNVVSEVLDNYEFIYINN